MSPPLDAAVLVAATPGSTVHDVAARLGVTRDEVVPALWRLCRDGRLVPRTVAGRVVFA